MVRKIGAENGQFYGTQRENKAIGLFGK